MIFQGKFKFAFYFIIFAKVFNLLDGGMARIKAETELGKQMNSLSDIVSFGLAPAFLFFIFSSHTWFEQFSTILFIV